MGVVAGVKGSKAVMEQTEADVSSSKHMGPFNGSVWYQALRVLAM